MAGVTHSAFRRLVSDFGGAGALFTEMLLAKLLLQENFRNSPYVKRRPGEGRVFYQLLLNGADGLEPVIDRLVAEAAPAGIDVNCACPAPDIRSWQAGAALFENAAALRGVLETVRKRYDGILTVKIRLGTGADGWEARLRERLALFEACGVDAVTLHPRFAGDKLKRVCRHDLYAWAASLTRLPLIASGDISPEAAKAKPEAFAALGGIMVGRLAAAQPWIFAQWGLPPEARGPSASSFDGGTVGYWEVWSRLADYVEEDFPPEKRFGRVKIFTEYFSRNFLFGHSFFTTVRAAPDLAAARVRAEEFLRSNPQTVREPSFAGI